MRRKIFRSLWLSATVAAVFVTLLISLVLYAQSFAAARKDTRLEALLLAAAADRTGTDYLPAAAAIRDDLRLTLIAPDGTVVFDSAEDPAVMENHLGRSEVQEALKTGAGEAVRKSETVGLQTIYYAVRLKSGDILRVASVTENVWRAAAGSVPYLFLVCILAAALSALLARHRTARIVAPINAIDPERPFEGDAYDELSPLLTKIERQNRQIRTQMTELSRREAEFASVTENMNEGLIVINTAGKVLLANDAALHWFAAAREAVVGRHLCNLSREETLARAAEAIARAEHFEGRLTRGARTLQLMANPTREDGRATGGILLLLDVTESANAESMRREFSASVSHELKTPLTAISGYAEIMRGGIAKPQDCQRFAGLIYDECARLIHLVEDIIALSRLDEGRVEAVYEPVSVLRLAQAAAGRLEDAAAARHITVTVAGDDAGLVSVPHILDTMLFNLLENAVKYNRDGGSVTLTVKDAPDAATVTVADTGIGIPAEYQKRVFERFFRVDRSRSKAIGGTGLGLSIVKHGAIYLGAALSLQSTPGVGTAVTLRFPKNPA
ncbi:MAG TPA: ATP-binding protein [Oscillospiraceae bacterium]|nr:ATP-binding protein [Oscillospiraceae bacterium]HPE15463.1 ATP-binding protein [Oscillospiraceae bacterium]